MNNKSKKSPRGAAQTKLNRRQFLNRCGTVGLAGAGLASGLGSTSAVNALQPGAGASYKALVCVFLYGGNDGYNMLVPTSNAEYQLYQNMRQQLALPLGQLLPLGKDSKNVDYGIQSSMPEMQALYQQGKLAIQGNVGPLVEPTTREQYQNKSTARPEFLFSHNHQQAFWQKLSSTGARKTGWGGQFADLTKGLNANPSSPISISLSGRNIWQTGATTSAYSIGENGADTLRGFREDREREARRLAAFNELLAHESESLFVKEFARVQEEARQLNGLTKDAVDTVQLNTVFPNTGIGRKLRMIARMLASRTTLGVSRQTFFVGQGGFDNHGNLLTRQPLLLADVSAALKAFYDATVELGIAEQVTTFTQSDFGRKLIVNGAGSDHGWGNHHLVIGGSVRGGTIYGDIPEYDLNATYNNGKGRPIPTTSVDQYGATLGKWFGLDDSELGQIFPYLNNFAEKDVGFMIN